MSMACAIAGGTLLLLFALLAPLAWERVRAERLKNLWKIACIAVQAAEQRGGSGAQKRAYAQALLRDRYPRLGARAAEALLEAAVRELA